MKQMSGRVLVVISFLFLYSFAVHAGEADTQKKLEDQKRVENAKKYIIGSHLGMVAMYYSNIIPKDSLDIGFTFADMYKKTGKYNSVIRVWLLNSSDKVINVNPLNFKVVTEKRYTIPLSDYTFQTRNPFPSTSLEPRTKIDGFVVFGLDERDTVLKIIYDDGQGNRVERKYEDAVILGIYEREVKKYGLSK